MKKINSIGYAHRVIAAGLVLLVPLPLALWGLRQLLGWGWLRVAGIAFAVAGALVLAGFAVLLAIELRQDARIDRRYRRDVRHTRVQTPGGRWECQRCGHRGAAGAKSCPACGLAFPRGD